MENVIGWCKLGVCLTVLVASGCGSGNVPLEGTITLDDQPLAGGRIMLEARDAPVDERLFNAVTDDQGHYSIANAKTREEGIPPGEYRVRITSIKVPEKVDEMTKLPPERVPAPYRDGSEKLTVPAEGNTAANYEISTGSRR